MPMGACGWDARNAQDTLLQTLELLRAATGADWWASWTNRVLTAWC